MSPPKRTTDAVSKLDRFLHKVLETGKENVTEAPAESEQATGDTAKVLKAISQGQTMLTPKTEEVKVDISLLRQDFQKLCERVTETERRISHMEENIPPLQVSTKQLQQPETLQPPLRGLA